MHELTHHLGIAEPVPMKEMLLLNDTLCEFTGRDDIEEYTDNVSEVSKLSIASSNDNEFTGDCALMISQRPLISILAPNIHKINDAASKQLKKHCILFCVIWSIAMIIFVAFTVLGVQFVNDYYLQTMVAFYTVCFIVKRPLVRVASVIDASRIELYNSAETFNDISIEILNEWMLL